MKPTDAYNRTGYAWARLFTDAGLHDAASGFVQSGLAADPDSIEGRITQAILHLRQDRPNDALSILDALGIDHPEVFEQPDFVFLRAKALIAAGCEMTARYVIDELCEQFRDDTRPHRLMAALSLQHGDEAKAIEHLLKLLALEPTNRDARLILAELLEGADPNAALDVLTGEPTFRNDRDIRLRVVRLYRRLGRLADARDLSRDAADDPDTTLLAGQIDDELGDSGSAIARLGSVVQAGGRRRHAALPELAKALMHAGDFQSAGRAWWMIARRQNDDAVAWMGVAACALAAGRNRLAEKIQQRLAAVDLSRRQQILATHWQAIAGGLTVRDLKSGLDEVAQDPDAVIQGMLADAACRLSGHLLAHPSRADMFYHLGVCRVAQGDEPAGRTAVDSALAINPNYAAARNLREKLAA